MTTSPHTSDDTLHSTTLVHSKAEIITLVNEVLDQYYQTSTAKADLLHPRYKLLLEVMHEFALAGGKRMRPYIAVTTYEVYGGRQYEDMCVVGASLELLHTAMLIHDDIIDRDLTRYGVDNVAGRYQKIYTERAGGDEAHYASAAAILAGDINLSAAYQLVLDSGFSSEEKITAQRILAEAVFHVIGGELIDTESVLFASEETDPITVSELKTAYYSFVTPLLCGAVLAGAGESELQQLTELGMKLGVAFQLADDLLGVYGDENITGKSNIGDIREGRRTWMAEKARSLADAPGKLLLHEYYGNKDVTKEQAEAIRQLFSDSGAKQACIDKIDELSNASFDIIERLDISSSAKDMYRELVISVTKRDQ